MESLEPAKNHGWTVTFCAMGINLALGVLYSWSVISKGIPKDWNWGEAEKSLPYAVACLVFSIVMVPAGRLQDKLGPRLTASIGGVLVGAGLILASFMTTPFGYIVGFGLLSGSGFGFGYAAATPPAVKWFPPQKTGLISGIVVSGFGLASVYVAPLTNSLIKSFGLPKTDLILGLLFFAVVVTLAQFLRAPHKVLQFSSKLGPASDFNSPAAKKGDSTPKDMFKTPVFYILWFMYACGAGAGLMVIAKLASIVKMQANISLGFLLVAILAIGNGGGRIIAGIASDKIGRQRTMLICFICQAILVFLLSRAVTGSPLANIVILSVISALIGANYGANLALFPSITKDYWGLKNFGINYGVVFTAWGVGGFMLSFFVGKLYDKYHSFTIGYYTASTLLIIAAILSFLVKPPKAKTIAAQPAE
jgi:OFA family oxalate/formate antiporter-like MFS transporter